MQRIAVITRQRVEAVDVTRQVREAVRAAGLRDGLAHLHCPHTTATLVVNEAADPDVARDILATYERLVPRSGDYRHAEGNSQAHVLSSLAGCGLTLPVEAGELALGTWQGVFFVELDGPRRREVWVRCVASPA
ncbi:MAG: YjbQ family protein [Myxococcales bacterium]|nr:YjbQ family protein [Myxococcales bacterium]